MPKTKPVFSSQFLIEEYINKDKSLRQIAKENNTSYATLKHYLELFQILKIEEDLSTRVIGRLTVIQFIKSTNRWECQCSCGKLTYRRYKDLIDNKILSCGCFKTDRKQKESGSWKGYEDISADFFSILRRSAVKRKIDFNIKIEDIWQKYLEQNRKCRLSNLDINFGSVGKYNCSVDRIDSNKGYSIDNIQLLHKSVNLMKVDLPELYFIQWCYFIHNKIDLSLPCCIFGINKNHALFKGFGCLGLDRWNTIKRNAKIRELQFDLSIEEAWDLLVQQNGKCAITNIPLFLSGLTEKQNQVTASLDRIDSSKGYTIDNVWWIHRTVNYMKLDLSLDALYSFTKNIILNNSNPNIDIDLISNFRVCMPKKVKNEK